MSISDIAEGIGPSLKDASLSGHKLKGLKKEADLNGDDKTTMYELLYTIFTVPKYIAGLFGLISAVYGIVQVILGFIDEFNTMSLIVSIFIMIAMAVIYLILSKIGTEQKNTTKMINDNWQEKLQDQGSKHQNEMDDLREDLRIANLENVRLADEKNAWIINYSIYRFVLQDKDPDALKFIDSLDIK